MNIYLIRHAESEWQLNQSLSKDSNITNIGIMQSYYLNNYIRNLIDTDKESSIIYVSPLRRTIQTVNSLDKDYMIESQIMEASFHVAESLPQFARPHIYKRKLSEELKYNEFKMNIRKTLVNFLSSTKNQNIYLYTHGGVIKTILRIIHDNDSICYKINNCSITKIIWKRRWHIDCINNISFLPKEYIT